ncbi:MAG TPA: PAS domain S-box protein [Armatimonadota bacterium]|jgi:PAS domain S-box-containing protein
MAHQFSLLANTALERRDALLGSLSPADPHAPDPLALLNRVDAHLRGCPAPPVTPCARQNLGEAIQRLRDLQGRLLALASEVYAADAALRADAAEAIAAFAMDEAARLAESPPGEGPLPLTPPPSAGEPMFRELVEHAPFGYQAMDANGRLTEVNRTWQDMLGYARDEVIGRRMAEFLAPEEIDAFRRQFQRLQQEGGVQYEATVIRRDGSRRRVAVEGRPALNAEGELIQAFCVLCDVTDRVVAEEALRQERVFTKAILDSVPGLLYLYDDQGCLVRWNRQHEELTGYSAEELASTHLMDWYKGDEKDIAAVSAAVQRVMEEGHADTEAGLITKSGQRIIFYLTGVRLEIDGRRYFVGIGIDITQRRQMEEKLRESEERLSLALDAVNDGVWDWNLQTGDAVFSPRWFTMLGYSPDEFPQRFSTWESLVHPDDVVAAERAVRERIASGEPYAVEFRMRARSGEWRWISARGNVVERDAGGNPLRMVGTHTDITRRKQMEQALVVSEERFRSIFESAPLGIFQSTVAGRFIGVNPAMARMMGYDSPQEMVTSITDITRQLTAEPGQRAWYIRDAMDAPGFIQREVVFRRADGTTMVANLYMRVVRAPNGDVAYLDGFIEDITERRRAEVAIRESEQRYRSVVDLTAQIVYTFDPNGDTRDLGKWASFTGQTPDDTRHGGWLNAIHPDDRAAVASATAESRASQTPSSITLRLRRADGVYRKMEFRGVPIHNPDGSIREWVNTGTDITELDAAAEAVRRRTRQLELLSLAARHINADLETPIVMRRLVEAALSACEARSGTCGLLHDGRMVFTESCVEGVWLSRRLTYEAGSGVPGWVMQTGEPYVVADTNTDPHVTRSFAEQFAARDLVCVPIIGRNGAMLGCFLLFNSGEGHAFSAADVVILEGMAASAATALENARLLEERTAAERALREAHEAKDRFMALLSHELRNPLAAITNAAQLLRSVESEDPRLTRAREVIGRSAASQARILEDLLDISRVTLGQIELRRQPLRLDTLAASVVRSLAAQAAAKKLEIQVDAEQGVTVDGDPIRLEQALVNLVVNAIKYTPEGSVWVTLHRSGPEAVLCVRDTGIGIAPEMLGRVFDMFAQADSSLSHADGGLGLGLSLVRSYVELHGGTVSADSRGPGMGATFTIRLPAIEEPAQASPAPDMGESVGAAGLGPRVLLVDDNDDARETLRDILEMEGCVVCEASDGPSAVEAALREHSEVILLDIGLPGFDGYEVARRLRASPEAAGVRIVAMTGYGQEVDRQRSLAAGCDQHLTKPVDLSALRSAIRGG